MKKRILIVIPAYNEEKNLPFVISDIEKHIPRDSIDILLVDDGSSDMTAQIAENAGLTVIKHPFNMGSAASIITGLMYAFENGYEVAITFDADGQHRAEDLLYLLQKFNEKEADLLIGSRFLSKGSYKVPLLRRAGMGLFSYLVSILSGHRITDASSGYRIYSRNAMGILVNMDNSDYLDADIILFLSKCGLRIIEEPVIMRKRISGTSQIRRMKTLYYVYKNLLSTLLMLLRERPRSNFSRQP